MKIVNYHIGPPILVNSLHLYFDFMVDKYQKNSQNANPRSRDKASVSPSRQPKHKTFQKKLRPSPRYLQKIKKRIK